MRQPVGERGRGLSAGQRQLITLARAELVGPDLLLLDEATATLDQDTETALLVASRSLTRNRTSVIVAHRLATAAQADRIAVVVRGRIVETGTHAELLAAVVTAVAAERCRLLWTVVLAVCLAIDLVSIPLSGVAIFMQPQSCVPPDLPPSTARR